MPSKFEQSHNSDNGEELQNVSVLHVGSVLLENQIDVEAHCGYVVDDVDRGLDEFALVRGRYESDEDLQSKPRVADAFDVEEGDVCVRLHFVQSPALGLVCGRHCVVPDHRHSHVWMRFQTERYYGHAYEEY